MTRTRLPRSLCLFLAWALVAPALAAVEIHAPEDLGNLSAANEDLKLLGALEDISLRDATGDRYTPFASDVDHRFRVRGRIRSRVPELRIDTEAWTAHGALHFALTLGQADAALKALEDEIAADRLARMGLTARGVTVRPSGYAGHVDVDIRVELALAGTRFRLTATYRVADSGAMIPGAVRPPDLLRFVASARRDAFFRLLEPRAHRADGALAVDVRGARLEMPVGWDEELAGGNKLAVGGTFWMELATGRAGFTEVSLPLADLPKCGVRELAALAARPDVAWLVAHATPGSDAHITVRPAGWIVRLSSGGGWRLDLAVDDRVEVLASSLPADAQAEPAAREDAALRGFLAQAAQVTGADQLVPLQRAFPDVLLLEVSAAELAHARGAEPEAKTRTTALAKLVERMQAAWTAAGAAAARGALPEAALQARKALAICPTDARIWMAVRRLEMAARDELPEPLPAALGSWMRVPHDAPRLIARVRALQARLGLPVLSTAPSTSTSAAPAVPELAGWKTAALGQEPPAWPGGPSRSVARLEPSPSPDPALPGLALLEVFPPVALKLDRQVLAGVLNRITALRIGSTALVPRPHVSLWMEALDAQSLLPPLDETGLRPVPDGMIENLGPLRCAVLARAYQHPVALFSFSARSDANITAGPILGVDVPDLAQQLVLRAQVAGGQLDSSAIRELLTPLFDAGALPSLGQAEVHATPEALELSYLPRGQEPDLLLRSLRRKTAFLALTPGRLRLEHAALLAIGGALRVAISR